jgi:hypothetical protein
MVTPPILQIAALALTLAICISVIFVTFTVRRTFAEQQEKLVGVIAAAEELHQLQVDFVQIVRRLHSDSAALQKTAMHVEESVAALNTGLNTATSGVVDRQAAAIEILREYMEGQEQRLAAILATISAGVSTTSQPSQAVERAGNGHSKLRRDALQRDPGLRFSVLKEWLSINVLAILRRASRPWKNASDLIVSVPAQFEPVAEILDGCVLVIGTHDHPERLAIPLRALEPSSAYNQWFRPPQNAQTISQAPAILMRSNGELQLVAKGTS